MKKTANIVLLVVLIIVFIVASVDAKNTDKNIRRGYNEIVSTGKAVGNPGGEITVPQVWFGWGAYNGKITVDAYCNNCLPQNTVVMLKNGIVQSSVKPQETTVVAPEAEAVNEARLRTSITEPGSNVVAVRVYTKKNAKDYFEYSVAINAPIFEIWLYSIERANGFATICYAVEPLFTNLKEGDEIDLWIDGMSHGSSVVTKNQWGQLIVQFMAPVDIYNMYILGERKTTATIVGSEKTTEKIVYYWPLSLGY